MFNLSTIFAQPQLREQQDRSEIPAFLHQRRLFAMQPLGWLLQAGARRSRLAPRLAAAWTGPAGAAQRESLLYAAAAAPACSTSGASGARGMSGFTMASPTKLEEVRDRSEGWGVLLSLVRCGSRPAPLALCVNRAPASTAPPPGFARPASGHAP